MNNPWETYWKDNNNNTFQENYSDDNPMSLTIRRFLKARLANVEQQVPLLDLGAGKGNNIKLYQDIVDPVAKMPKTDFVGVDSGIAHDIETNRFHIRKATFEKLPFADNSFSIVTSLFAIEYGDSTDSTSELARVCSGGATFIGLLHRPDSVISQKSKMTLEFYQLLVDDGFLDSTNFPSDTRLLEKEILIRLKTVAQKITSEMQYDFSLVVNALKQRFANAQFLTEPMAKAIASYFYQLLQHREILILQRQAAINYQSVLNALLGVAKKEIYNENLKFQDKLIGQAICLRF